MAIPEIIKQSIEEKLKQYCFDRIPAHVKNQVKMDFKIRGNNITLFELRPAFGNSDKWIDLPVAQFRYNPKNSYWVIYCADRNSKWHEYMDFDPTEDFDELIREVENDPTGIFWG